MDVSYSTSSVQGYRKHLATQEVVLPLKYPVTTEVPSPNDHFHTKLANSGGVIELSKGLVDTVVYEISNDLKTIVLSPVVTSSNHLGLKFQNLKFALPHPLISPSCFSIQFQETTGEDGALIIDSIDTDHLFITFKIEIADFIHSKSNSTRLSISNFNQWGNISVPYSFELRSSPYLLKSFNPHNLIVSLKDGGLLHFQRPGILTDFDVFNFNEAPSLLPLNFLSGLFKKNSKQQIVLEGISSNAVVDLVQLGEDTFFTLSVSKVIKTWSLQSHIQTSNPIYLSGSIETGSWLTSVPTKYLQLYNSSEGNTFLTLHINTNSNDTNSDKSGFEFKTWEVLDSKYLKESAELAFQPELPNLLLVSLKSSQEKSDFQNKLWFIQDYQTQVFDGFVKYHILWKSNTSSIIVAYTINRENGSIISINWSHIHKDQFETAPHNDISYYSNIVLSAGRYDDLIVITSLNVLRDHLGKGAIGGGNSIRDSIAETLSIWTSIGGLDEANPDASTILNTADTSDFAEINLLSTQSDLKITEIQRTFWFKFFSLCEEYKKLSEESLAIGFISNSSFLLSVQANGLGIYRTSHFYESFLYKRKLSPEGKLATILTRFQDLLSTKTIHRLYQVIKSSKKLNATEVTEIFETYLRSKVSDEEITEILTELDNIPNGIDLINSLIDSIDDYEFIVETSGDSNKQPEVFDKLNIIITFKEIKQHHENLLLNLVILFLVCEANDQILLLINKLLSRLSTYNVVNLIFDTCFRSGEIANSPIETRGISNLENSLFWSSIVDKHPNLNHLLKESKLNEAYDFFYGKIISKNENYITDVTIDLINRNEGKFVREALLDKLDESKAIDKFLIGLIYLIDNRPNEFYEVFQDYSIIESGDFLDKINSSLKNNESISKFLDSIFSSESSQQIKEAKYFHALSELAKAQGRTVQKTSQSLILTGGERETGSFALVKTAKEPVPGSSLIEIETNFTKTALKFEQRAIGILKSNSSIETFKALLGQYYLNLFELSMNLSDYDLIYEALSNLEDSITYRDHFTRFVKKLIVSNSIPTLFPPNKNDLYRKHYLLIDGILLELANDELTLSKSLRYYEYLYSWRLFGASSTLDSEQLADKRGAVESLYLFITRFKLEHSLIQVSESSIEDVKQYKLKILELYMVILNCLRSFEQSEDKWILKRTDINSLKVITLDELKVEYYEWLKELEGDLQE